MRARQGVARVGARGTGTGVLLLILACLVGAAPAQAADRNFAKRFGATDTGDIRLVGNTIMTCSVLASNCAAARAGTASSTLNNNNSYLMQYVDADSDATTFSSSRADLSLPAGATVLFAGLYWGGDSSATDSERRSVKLDTPAIGGYVDLTGSVLDTSTATPTTYQAFADVTGLVNTAGSGTYWVGNVRGNPGAASQHAGWSLVVAYRDPAAPRNNLAVFDGFRTVQSGSSLAVPVSGLTTPGGGTVDASVGVVAHETDRGTTGDSVALGATALSDALNPGDNVLNGSITRRGTRLTAKQPDYVNQLGLDADVVSADGLIAPGATSATLNLSSSADIYHPGVLTLATESETIPPDTTVTTGPAGPTSDSTPTFSFSSSEAGSSFQCRVDGGAWGACTSPHTTAVLADGSHTFDVRAADQAGNVDPTPATRSFTVDTAAPETTIAGGPSGPTSTSTPTFTFTAGQAGSTFECRIDGGAWSSCASPHSTAALADGSHIFEVRAIDPAGNVDPTPAARGFSVDTAAPETTIAGGPSGPTGDATPAFTFTASEGGSTFECRVDGGAWTPCASPETTSGLPDGPHSFDARAIDPAGNVDGSPASRTFTVDTIAPQTAIDSGPSDPTADATPTLSFSADEPGATFECRVDAGAWQSCSSPMTTGALSDGEHGFEVRATDPAGNVDGSPASRTFTVDTTAPQTSIESGPQGPTSDPTPTFEFAATEPGAEFECRVDGGAWSACSSPQTTAALPDGDHAFEVRAVDPAGNADDTAASRAFTVDTNTPQTTIDSGPSGPTADPTPSFSFSSDEAGAAFECRVDGGAWNPCSSPETTASLTDGEHTFEVRAIDPAGNADATPAARAITVDTEQPQTTIESGPQGPTNDPTATFEFVANEPEVGFECRVDGGDWTACGSPETSAALPDGDHTFEVRATDPAGNADATPAERRFTVDTRAPETAIESGPQGPTANATPSFAFGSDEEGSSFECRVDAGAWASCASPETTAPLAEGAHGFEVRALDPAGNVDGSPASRTFTVDTIAPQSTIDSGPEGPTGDETPTFEFSANEPGVGFECRVDAGVWQPCTSPETTSSLSDGAHTFEVRATDEAGNVDETPASRSFTVDTENPLTTIDSGPEGPTSDPTPTFEFSADEPGSTFECRVDADAWEPCASPETTDALSDGEHTFAVRAVDSTGNVDETPAARGFTVDTDSPQTTIEAGPTGPTGDATPTFEFGASEPSVAFECSLDGGAWASCASPETTPALTDGEHTFAVRATDLAGNVDETPAARTFSVDTAPPQTTIESGPSGTTGDATPTFELGADEPGSTFECRVDGGAWTLCSSPETTASLPDGEHTFEVRATDPAGNTDQTPASRSFAVDTNNPQTTIDSGPSNPGSDSTPSFEFSSDEPGSTFECRVDAGGWSPCASPETTAPLSDGEHTFEVRATDPAGNVDQSPASLSFTVDTDGPQTTIESGPAGPTGDATPTFEFAADEPGSTFECRVDAGTWQSCSSPSTTGLLTDGEHSFEARATDPSGNVDSSPASRTFVVDTDTPQTAIDTGPQSPTGDATPSFEFSADEPGATFECRVDGGAWAPCTSPETTASLPDGEHTFEVRATDPAGNTDETAASRTFMVDTRAPQARVDSGPSGPTPDATPTFGFSADETAVTFECRVDGGAWSPCISSETTPPLPDGEHTFEVRATDPAGNTELAPASRTFTVDTEQPQTTIGSGPAGPTADMTPTFEFSADEPGATFECRVDGGTWVECASPETTAPLSDGDHTFEVRATDEAGNADPAPAERVFTVDTGEPQTTIQSGPSGPTADATPTFGFSADAPGSSFECRLDDGAWQPCTSPETTTSLGDGEHTLAVRATDPAGNVDSSPALRTFVVDTGAPQTTIDSGPSGPTRNAAPAFGFGADEAGSTFECRVDGGAWWLCSSPETTAPLEDGEHTFEVRATDGAGNADDTPAVRSFTVDTDSPQTTIDSGPAGTSGDATPSFGFSSDEAGSTFECRVDGAPWAPCTSPETTASLPDGAHTFEVRAVDPAGNVDPAPATRDFTVDTSGDTDPPDTDIDSGPEGPTADATPTFDFSADEPGSTFECSVDAGPWTPCAPPETSALLSDGAHTFAVQAIDPAGNVDPTEAERSFTVDTVDPQTTIQSGPDSPTRDDTPSFEFSANESDVSFECRVDGGAWEACSSPATTSHLPDGEHTFEVRAIDAAGNQDPDPASRTFTVDTRPPSDSGPGPGGPGGGSGGPGGGSGPQFAPPGDLSGLPGSLVGERSCQRIGSGAGTRRLRARGIGTLRVTLHANPLVTADDPLTVTVSGPRSLRTVRYALDGRPQRGARRAPFALAIEPAALRRIGRHALTLRLMPSRGPSWTARLGFRTLGCPSVFRAHQRRTRTGSRLKLRVDARDPVGAATFRVPARMLPKPVARVRVGRLRLVAAGPFRLSRPLTFGRNPRTGVVLAGARGPRVALRGGTVTVTGLPAGTGIVEIILTTTRSTRPRALLAPSGAAQLRARITGPAPQRLTYRLRGLRR